MIELPEALTLAKQLEKEVVGKVVARVNPPTKPHKFCWFNGDPCDYELKIRDCELRYAEGFGIFAEIGFSNGERLCINDGVNVRYLSAGGIPKDYQLLIVFTDGTALVFTVAMYGSIILHSGDYENKYYLKSRNAVSPFSNGFEAYYHGLLNESRPAFSAKAFLATEQRFPGIGNGVLQDILFAAHINPKRKIGTLSDAEKDMLLTCITSVLREMTELGGRDTEKDLFGGPGGYQTKMSKNALSAGCPACGGAIKKEAYLGGSVYYCPVCQPFDQR
ncbi:MAG: endonuclease VIII [Oscillospiraceae bacterium]|nr:endonuclease VIII [Oscillospiraceae bacterium]